MTARPRAWTDAEPRTSCPTAICQRRRPTANAARWPTPTSARRFRRHLRSATEPAGAAAATTGSSRRACSTSRCRACRSTSATSGARTATSIVTDNRAVSAADYDPFSITAPADARLPGGGGSVSPGSTTSNRRSSAPADNFVTFASNFGEQIEHWNGVDITINARLRAASSCRAARAPAGRSPTTATSSPSWITPARCTVTPRRRS